MSFNFSSVQTFRENISVKDVVFSSIPTVPTYTGLLNGVLPVWFTENHAFMILTGIGIFIVFLTLLFFYNKEANKKSLAQILATGYFQNFSGKLYFLLTQNQELSFLLPNQQISKVHPKNVFVEIILPQSRDALRSQTAHINSTTQIAYIDSNPFNEPFWVRIKQHEDDTVTIVEIPRTLFALPKFLSEAYTQQASVKMHAAFNKKFKQLIEDNANIIPVHQFNIVEQA
jgi:hypothetical protein